MGAALPAAQAQEFSADGNRWYEVEVSIFAIELPRAPDGEQPVPANTQAAYLPRLQALLPAASSYQVEFAVAASPVTELSGQSLSATVAGQLSSAMAAPPSTPLAGPVFSPALRESFRVLDPAYDPYLELDPRSGQFGQVNRNLQDSGDYRVLWHRLWRQPMLGRNQVRSVFVAGGEFRAGHMEVEGSMRLSDGGNAGRVMLDLDIWLNRFMRGMPADDAPWQVPELPLPVQAAEAEVPDTISGWSLSEVWQQEQTRELAPGQLYYIDHPALGVLVEIRPYLLPLRETLLPEEEF